MNKVAVKDLVAQIDRLLERAQNPEYDTYNADDMDAYALGWAGSCLQLARNKIRDLDALLSKTK